MSHPDRDYDNPVGGQPGHELEHQGDDELEPGELPDAAGMAELMQGVEAGPAVPVRVTERVTVEPLPRYVGTMTNHVLIDGDKARPILGRDPRRARAIFYVLSGSGGNAVFALTEGMANADLGILLPASSVPLRIEIEAFDELWAKTAADASANLQICIITEYWSR
jgi:hypothetical protein